MAYRSLTVFALLFWSAGLAVAGPTNHFDVALTISDGDSRQSGNNEMEPPAKPGRVERPVLQVHLGDRCAATWKLTSASKETLKDILVHFYVVRIDRPGQDPPPLEPSEVVYESAQTLDFAYKESTSASVEFVPDRPGLYLCRVETQGSAEAKGHEHYSAVELNVK